MKCYIIQPGRVGDIIICLPIAEHYYNLGYKVVWFVHESVAPLFDYVDYVKPFVIRESESDIGHSVPLAYSALEHIKSSRNDVVLDLSIGFFGSNAERSGWRTEKLSFDRWKYKEAKVPFNRKYNLSVNRNAEKERELVELLNIPLIYDVVHEVSSRGKYWFTRDPTVETIPVRPIKGFTLFDWIPVLKMARRIFCVDSCVSNIMNQLGIGMDKRFFRPWDKMGTEKRILLMPELASGWEVIEPE